MASKAAEAATAIPMFGGLPDLDGEEMPLDMGGDTPGGVPKEDDRPRGVDLSDRRKLICLIGEGNRGKTTLARLILEWRAMAGLPTLAAALDPRNRTLAHFFAGVVQPGSQDPATRRFVPTFEPGKIAKWLEDALLHLIRDPQDAVFDFGGGDPSLMTVLGSVPDAVEQLEKAGVSVVALYCLGPREADLTALHALEARGFRPRATALVRNEAVALPHVEREVAFARVVRHSAYQAAVRRGAMELWLPRLHEAAGEIEAKRLHFTQARDGISPEGRTVAPLGPFNRSRVRVFLDRAAWEMDPIKTWLR